MEAWKRAIILVDMNAYFASIEQLDDASLRNKPIAVTNGAEGSCIITCSYEARAFGIHTGMRLYEAKKRCPQLIRCASRPERYVSISRQIMKSLETITPDIEIFSVDEAFLDVSHCQSLHGTPIEIGHMVRQQIWQQVQLPCSIGISGDKTTAKYAAKLEKPNGLTVIEPWNAKQQLKHVPVDHLCGIGPGISAFLKRYGVTYCGDMQNIPIGILAKRFGNLGRRLWYMCQGADPSPVKTHIADPKSMGHGKVLPPGTCDRDTILTYLHHMSEKLAIRLRKNKLCAQRFSIGLKTKQYGWLGDKVRLTIPIDDGNILYQQCKNIMNNCWQRRTTIAQVQITALDPQPVMQQADLFHTTDKKRQKVNRAMDHINQRFGKSSCMPAHLLTKKTSPDVIAPSWQPDGHRENIDN
jgi:DNA polymerase IV